jgi:hypothetical protein
MPDGLNGRPLRGASLGAPLAGVVSRRPQGLYRDNACQTSGVAATYRAIGPRFAGRTGA